MRDRRHHPLRKVILWAILLFLVFLWVGPSTSLPALRESSLAVRARLAGVYQHTLGDRVDAIKEDLTRNPIQGAFDRREEQFAKDFEAVTGEEFEPGDRCLTFFGLIPLNCPDPAGGGFITPDP